MMWQPTRSFKENFTAIGFFLVSIFIIAVFAMQCGLWVLVPIFLLVIVLKVAGRKRK